MRFTFVVALLAQIFVRQIAIAQDFQLEAKSSITANAGGYMKVQVDLGSLPQNKKGTILVSVDNRTGTTLELRDFTSTCKCIDAQIDRDQIPDGESGLLTINLRTASKPKSVKQAVSFSFGDPKNRSAVTAIVHYRIEQLVAFREVAVSVNAFEGDREVRFRLPLEVADATQFNVNSVKVVLPDCFSAMHTKIIQDAGEFFLEGRIDTEKLAASVVAGDLKMLHRETDMEDRVLLSIIQTPRLQVVPKELKISRIEKESSQSKESNQYKGESLVRFQRRPADRQADEKIDPRLRNSFNIEARLANAKVSSDVTMLSPNVARVVFTITPSNPEFDPESDVDGMFIIANFAGETLRTKLKVKRSSSTISIPLGRKDP